MYLGRRWQRSRTLHPLYDYVFSCSPGLYFIDCLCLKLLSDIWLQLSHAESLEVAPSTLAKEQTEIDAFLRRPQGTAVTGHAATWVAVEHCSWSRQTHGRRRGSRELAEADKRLEGGHRAVRQRKPPPAPVSSASPGSHGKNWKTLLMLRVRGASPERGPPPGTARKGDCLTGAFPDPGGGDEMIPEAQSLPVFPNEREKRQRNVSEGQSPKLHDPRDSRPLKTCDVIPPWNTPPSDAPATPAGSGTPAR